MPTNRCNSAIMLQNSIEHLRDLDQCTEILCFVKKHRDPQMHGVSVQWYHASAMRKHINRQQLGCLMGFNGSFLQPYTSLCRNLSCSGIHGQNLPCRFAAKIKLFTWVLQKARLDTDSAKSCKW